MDVEAISTPRQAGIYVRRAREAQGLTRAELAVSSSVSVRSLASLEMGDATGIRLDKLLAVYAALGLSLVTQGESIASDAQVNKPLKTRGGKPRKTTAVKKVHRSETDFSSYDDALQDFITNYTNIDMTDGADRTSSLKGL